MMVEKRSPKLLKRLLVEPVSPDTSEKSAIASKEAAVDERAREAYINRRKKEKDFVDSVVRAVSSNRALSGALNVAVCKSDHDSCLVVVTTKTLYLHEPAKHISRLRLVLCGDGSYYIQVLLTTVEEGNVATPEEFVSLCEKIADNKNFKFCPGIDLEEYEQCKEMIKYDPKSVRVIDVPVKRISSSKCKLWYHTTGRGISKQKKEPSEMICSECGKLRHYLQATARRLSSVPPEKRVQREQADSCYPMKYLSSESLQRRKMNIKSLKAREKRKIKRKSSTSGETCFVLPPVVPVENKFHQNDLSVTPPP